VNQGGFFYLFILFINVLKVNGIHKNESEREGWFEKLNLSFEQDKFEMELEVEGRNMEFRRR
jgi:hypothetical protein